MSESAFNARKGRSVDLLTGTPWKKIGLFAVPLIIGNIFQQLYNTADSVIVGRNVGHTALAAVGVSSPMLFLLVSVFMGVATGSSVLVAQYFGARNLNGLRKVLHTSILLAVVVGLILSMTGYFLAPAFLNLLNTPKDTYGLALEYMRILFLGIIGQMLYNMVSGFMRGMGNARTPLYILIAASVTNVVLDLIFIIPLQMGVAGAAWATIISQMMSAILVMTALHRAGPLTRITKSELKIDLQTTKDIVTIGVPTAIQQGIISLGGVVIQGLVNSYGTYMIAGHNAAMRVDMFAVMPIMSFSMAMVSYTGQNVGAGKMDRVYKGVRHGLGLLIGVTIITTTVLFFFAKNVLQLFTDDVQTLEAGNMIIRTIVPFYVLFAINQTLGGIMRGAGETVVPMINALLMNILVRVPLAFVLNNIMQNPQAIYLSQVGGWIVGVTLMLIFYKRGSWEKKALARIEILQKLDENALTQDRARFERELSAET